MSKPLDLELQKALAIFYVLCALMNIGFAFYYLRAKDMLKALVWGAVAVLFIIHAGAYFAHMGWVLPQGFRDAVNTTLNGPRGATIYVSVSVIAFVVMLYFRKFFVNPQVAWAMLMASLLFGGWAMTDPNFRSIVAKEDNVPISMLIYSVGFFTWLGMYRAVQNDDRMARGEPILEKLDDEKVLVWPDLVYTELICMIIATVVLIAWAVLLKAPLEQPPKEGRKSKHQREKRFPFSEKKQPTKVQQL